jgi:hypothetical protein
MQRPASLSLGLCLSFGCLIHHFRKPGLQGHRLHSGQLQPGSDRLQRPFSLQPIS